MGTYDGLITVQKPTEKIILVGEAHNNKTSEHLVSQVIENEKPKIIGVECSEKLDNSTGGLQQASQYASHMNIPLALLDEDKLWMYREADINRLYSVIKTANKYQTEIKENGDFTYETITKARNIVRDTYGEQVFRTIFTKREYLMTQRIKQLQNNFNKVVAVMGAFHILAVKDMIPIVTGNITPKRIIRPEQSNKWHKTEKIRTAKRTKKKV